jgi:hypothetical protein
MAPADYSTRIPVILRCTLDGLLLPANLCSSRLALVAFDSGEAFALEALEVMYYQLVSATRREVLGLEQLGYRLLRRAKDFEVVEGDD